jgi:hypothetical protein
MSATEAQLADEKLVVADQSLSKEKLLICRV